MMEGEKSGSGVNIMAFYKKIGNIYGRFGDYGRAMNIYEKGYSLRKRYPDRKTECDILFNLVGMCLFRRTCPVAGEESGGAGKDEESCLDGSEPFLRMFCL